MELTREDRLVFLGDVIVRGPDSRRVVALILDAGNSGRSDLVMGKHEPMLLVSLENPAGASSGLAWVGAETLDSYGGHIDDIPEVHLAFFAAGLPYVETDEDI